MRNPFPIHASQGATFLPEDYVARKAELRANFLSLTLFGVVMFGVVGAFFVTNRQWLKVRDEQKAINVLYTQEAQKIDQLKQLEKQKVEMLEKAEITTALIEKVPRSVFLSELIGPMPEQITLLTLDLKSKRIIEAPPAAAKAGPKTVKSLAGKPKPTAAAKPGDKPPEPPEKVKAPRFEYTLTLVGLATANEQIADYLAALQTCQLLERVEIQYIKESKVGERQLRKFEIVARLRPNADARNLISPETTKDPVADAGGEG